MDLKNVIGTFFAMLGLILVAYGLGGSDDLRVNLWWGCAMTLFGGVMLAAGRFAKR